ncbi:MAG: hypothetical protein AAFP90_22740 [Planctomycetota bacterium]
MAHARQVESWDHTATIVATLHNLNRGKSQRARRVTEFHPLRKHERPPGMTPAQLRSLKSQFTKS